MSRLSTLITVLTVFLAPGIHAQDTLASQSRPHWSNQVRYGGGPSMGAPHSDFDGTRVPLRWCLPVGEWERFSRQWLAANLSDTSSLGTGWRAALGGAPQLRTSDTVAFVADDELCRRVANVINRELLGWSVGPPPVVVLRMRDRFIAFPSNPWRGEFGYAVHLDQTLRVLGVATW